MTTVIDEVIAGLNAATAILELPELEPGGGRDWSAQTGKLEALWATVNDRILGHVQAALAETPADQQREVKDAIAHVVGMAAAVFDVAGNQARSHELLGKAAGIAASPRLQ